MSGNVIGDLLFCVITFIAFFGVLRIFSKAIGMIIVGMVESLDNAFLKRGIFVKSYPTPAFAAYVEPLADQEKFEKVCGVVANVVTALGVVVAIAIFFM